VKEAAADAREFEVEPAEEVTVPAMTNGQPIEIEKVITNTLR